MRWSPSETGQSAPQPESPASWVRVCAESDLTVNQPVRVLIGGCPVMVVRDGDGRIHALDDTCTHAEISLSEGFVEGATVECWAHGARFDLRSGAAVTLPAGEPLRVHGVSVRDGIVFLTPQPDNEGPDERRVITSQDG
jgi:3-phenylpropionate/trans-cinnamate dioxygenase ferredoxin subunit